MSGYDVLNDTGVSCPPTVSAMAVPSATKPTSIWWIIGAIFLAIFIIIFMVYLFGYSSNKGTGTPSGLPPVTVTCFKCEPGGKGCIAQLGRSVCMPGEFSTLDACQTNCNSKNCYSCRPAGDANVCVSRTVYGSCDPDETTGGCGTRCPSLRKCYKCEAGQSIEVFTDKASCMDLGANFSPNPVLCSSLGSSCKSNVSIEDYC